MSTLNAHTHSSKVWEQLNKIGGRSPRKMNILKINDVCFSSVEEIGEKLAEHFEYASSDRNYSDEFIAIKNIAEQRHLNFTSDNAEAYNLPVTIHELQSAIKSNRITAPGRAVIRDVSKIMRLLTSRDSRLLIRHMPENAHLYPLKIFNVLWERGYVSKD